MEMRTDNFCHPARQNLPVFGSLDEETITKTIEMGLARRLH
jgi:hypothetical protein